jgi:hypothetical protein
MRLIKQFEDFNSSEILDIDQLKSRLMEYSIPIETWGTGKSKTVENLLDELEQKECNVVDEGGYLVRYIEFVGIKIYYVDKNEDIWQLKEDRQEFHDGRIRRRSMPSSVSEKMKFGENPSIAAVRGIKEELGFEIEESQLSKRKDLDFNGGSISYPGLRAKYKGHQFICYLKDNQFNPGGYIERQKDKSTFFKWQKL